MPSRREILATAPLALAGCVTDSGGNADNSTDLTDSGENSAESDPSDSAVSAAESRPDEINYPIDRPADMVVLDRERDIGHLVQATFQELIVTDEMGWFDAETGELRVSTLDLPIWSVTIRFEARGSSVQLPGFDAYQLRNDASDPVARALSESDSDGEIPLDELRPAEVQLPHFRAPQFYQQGSLIGGGHAPRMHFLFFADPHEVAEIHFDPLGSGFTPASWSLSELV